MKKTKLLATLFVTMLLMTSCIWDTNDDDGGTTPFESSYDPVIIQRDILETSTEVQAEAIISESGKIYVKDQYLLINEPNKGFHIYNNSDPSNPQKIKFLKVLGSTDISIKGNVLYINNAVDLIALTFNQDFSDVTITKRVRNVFPVMMSPDGFYPNLEEDEVVVDWVLNN